MIYLQDDFGGSGGIGGRTPSPVTHGSAAWSYPDDSGAVYVSGGRLRFAESTIYPGTFELARLTGMDADDGVAQGAFSFEVKLDIAAGSADVVVKIGDGIYSSDSYVYTCTAVSGVVRLVFESQPDTSVEVTDYTSGSPVTSTISVGTVDGHAFRLQEIEIDNADGTTQVEYLQVTDPDIEPSSTWVNLVKCVEL